uniref:Ribosomal protein S6 kinase polypeptide 1 n=1 Tax=Cynoglossus semilaevis TaxID=244447 RepID=A0A3P8X2Z8_CYNSE
MISQRDSGELARFYTVTDPKKHQKGYTVYKVTARITVWKRYSDFRKLHQNLWQLHKNVCSQSELFPPFAKAKVFGRFDDSVIEERRQCSEDLLQFSANIPALYSSQHIQDFFKGGEVHDSSELIGPAEPFSDFLADSFSDCSSDGPSSGSALTSLAVDTDSLAGVDDGMASGGTSPNQPQGGAYNLSSSSPASSAPNPEVTWPSRTPLLSGSLRKTSSGKPKEVKSDYLDKATNLICVAVEKEKEQDYQAAFSYYRSGVDLLLQGVQGEPSPTRREAVKKKTAEYLMRAEQISTHYLKGNMGQGSTQTIDNTASQPNVVFVCSYVAINSTLPSQVLLVMDKRTEETFILKVKTRDASIPTQLLVSGGKLWSHIEKYLHNSSPEESFDIPFIQKSHTAAVHSTHRAVQQLDMDMDSASSGSGPVPGSDSLSEQHKEQEDQNISTSCLKNILPARPVQKPGPHSDSGAKSEEECTDSYLTLCNEYEQEKVESDALEEEEEKSEQEIGLMTHDHGEGLDNCEVFSPLPSPAVPLSLDQSKHTPMEFFRIDSKDSASEVTCLDFGEQRPLPVFSTSDLGSDINEEFSELAQEVKGHSSELWWLDCSDNESVPVISFQEAAIEDEGQPPDLLVNLPAVSGTVDSLQEELTTSGVCLGLEATASPHKFIQPDVLQLHSQPEDAAEQTRSSLCPVSATCDTGIVFSTPVNLQWNDCNLSIGVEASDRTAADLKCHDKVLSLDPKYPQTDLQSGKLEAGTEVNTESTADSITVTNETDDRAVVEGLLASNSELSGVVSNKTVTDFDKEVSRLFAELDQLSLAASQARIPEEFVRCWAVELVTALDSLHQEGIICRDLNPNNILLNHQGHIQMTYFCSWSDVEESCDKDAMSNMYCAPAHTLSDWLCFKNQAYLPLTVYFVPSTQSLLHCHPAGISRHTALNIPESVSQEARSLLEQLLQYNPTERLGAGAGGADDIRSHPFFATVSWSQ